MKTPISVRALAFVALLATFVCGGGRAFAQTPEVKTTKESFAQLQLAWNHLKQAGRDLVSTSPDVKGDTTRLEDAIKTAVNDLHIADPHSIPATTWYPGYDKGKSRDYIFNAVQGHLDGAKKALEASGLKSQHIDDALAEIDVANKELAAAKAAPMSAPAKAPAKTPPKK